jgi:general stress protein 26
MLALAFGLAWTPTLCAQQTTSRDSLITAAREIIGAARFCALVTLDQSGQPHARTMDPFPPEPDFVIRLGTSRRSEKVREIQNDPRLTLYYQDPRGDGYVALSGIARLVDDPAETARWWKPEWEPYYPSRARDDLLIAVTPRRMEVISYGRRIVGDPATWRPPAVEFPGGTPG